MKPAGTPLRLATRGSPLARWQTHRVAELLGRKGTPTTVVVVDTEGDRRADVPLRSIGGQGVFVKEVQAAVVRGEADAAVHAAKDLPSAPELADASLRGIPLPRRAPAGETVEAVDEAALLVRKDFVAGMNYLDEKRFSEYWSLLEVCWQIRNAGKKIVVGAEAGGVLHPGRERYEKDPLHIADRVSGAAAYIAKHNGMGAGISFRIKCFLSALGAFRVPLAFSILTGSRIDPTQ